MCESWHECHRLVVVVSSALSGWLISLTFYVGGRRLAFSKPVCYQAPADIPGQRDRARRLTGRKFFQMQASPRTKTVPQEGIRHTFSPKERLRAQSLGSTDQ
jgi:hypothetical protein